MTVIDTSPELDPVGGYRTVWISDVHLGTQGCSAAQLLWFLKHVECEQLYVVGDFIDVWYLGRKKNWKRHWPQIHNDVVQKVLRKARKGVGVVYIPGNHDEFCLDFLGTYGNIRVIENALHVTADGRRFKVMHGHEFDCVTRNAKWLALIGDVGYRALMRLNGPVNFCRKKCGLGYWSLSSYLKAKVKCAVNRSGSFESAVSHYARLEGVDGIICGHIHTPDIRTFGTTLYYNTGDWVESRTALVEHFDGRLELLDWDAITRLYGEMPAQCDAGPDPDADSQSEDEVEVVIDQMKAAASACVLSRK